MSPTSVIEMLGPVRLAPGVTVQRMEDEFLALVGQRVVRVAGPSAVVLAAVQQAAGRPDVAQLSGAALDADEVASAVDVLVDLGVLERSEGPAATPDAAGGAGPVGVSRRRVLQVAAAGALGVTVLVLPQAPAAASVNTTGVSGESAEPMMVPTGMSFSEVEEDGFTVSWTVGTPA